MKQKRPTTAECQTVIRQAGWEENQDKIVVAADTLMYRCETDPTITVEDGLACLDQGGVVAEIGARILYLLTGRDGLGWHAPGYNGVTFQIDKQNWLDYLANEHDRELP